MAFHGFFSRIGTSTHDPDHRETDETGGTIEGLEEPSDKVLADMRLNLMRYCNLFDPVTLGRITLREYTLRMKAVQLQKLDRERELYWQAWLTQQAQATKKKGKETVPYFKDFDAFFNYEARQADILGTTHTAKKGKPSRRGKDPAKLAALMAKANS